MKNNLARHAVDNAQHSEGPVAKAIEKQTTKIPSDVFLWAALASLGAATAFEMMGKRRQSAFIGQWAPTFLILGLYNKLVKIAGSEGESADAEYDESVYSSAA